MTRAATVTIAPMLAVHLHDVERLDREVQRQPWSREMLRSEHARRDSRYYLVALVGDEVVGYGGVLLVPPEAHVTTLGVAADHQRAGIGAMLLGALIRASAERGASDVTLEVRASNVAALALYRRCGFLAEGRRPRYYDDGEDALIMWRREPQPGRTDPEGGERS